MFLTCTLCAVLAAQAPAAAPARPGPVPSPTEVAGYVATVEVRAIAPDLEAAGRTGEAAALARTLKQPTTLVTRAYLAQDLSRQVVLSGGALLPLGTLVLHKAGERAYLLADPEKKTYAVMDGEALLDVLEGSAGVVDSQYEAKVHHTEDRKAIAGHPCRRSIVTVSYASTVPFETGHVTVQRTADVEVWHTASLVSSAALDHFFFKFQRDRTGAVRRALGQEIGFPMEMKVVVTQGAGARAAVQPGSFELRVTEVKKEPKLDPELFRIPPTGFRRVERLPFAVPAPAR